MKKHEQKPSVVVVDDEPVLLEAWNEILNDGFNVTLFSDPLVAMRHFANESPDVALLDVRMPGMDGLSLLQHLRSSKCDTEVIMVTGHGTIQMAVEAMQLGAYDFFCKPVDDLDAAVRRIHSAVERRRLRHLNASLRERLDAYTPGSRLIGESAGIKKVRQMLEQVADSTAPVLICGESGTGKELAARSLHVLSDRADKAFVAINCAAMSETLIDSELFGHERGAFTGANSNHQGLFEAADGGVLFLDEIGDVPLQTQVRLLRALQEGEVRPVGSTKSRKVDVRIVAATNVNLERAMREGKFREDLYYRISTFRVDLPPLRERRQDIPLIAHHLLQTYCRRQDKDVQGYAVEAMTALAAYSWPGNVRELNNAVEHAATLCNQKLIEPSHLPSFVATQAGRAPRQASVKAAMGSISSSTYSAARAQLLDEFEMRYIEDVLHVTGGNLSEASRRSGIDRSNLRRMLKRHSIDAGNFKGEDEAVQVG